MVCRLYRMATSRTGDRICRHLTALFVPEVIPGRNRVAWRLEIPFSWRESASLERPIMKLIRAKFLLVALLAAVATVASVATLTSANHHPLNVIASDDPKGGGGG
jgi:hypothetical protein